MKRQIAVLYLASRDPRTPIAAKYLMIIVVAYALSPIDLIPDFIPVLGYLDDLLLLPIGIYLAIKLIPDHLWLEFQSQVEHEHIQLPKNHKAAVVIGITWCLGFAGISYALWHTYNV